MRISENHRRAFLIFAVHVLYLSGCSFFGEPDDPMEVLREQVRTIVADPDRAEEMLATVDRIDRLLTESVEALAEAARRERMLFVDYESTPEDFEALFSEASHKRQKLQKAALDAHLEFKAKATAEEWNSIMPVHASAISMRVESLVIVAIAERG